MLVSNFIMLNSLFPGKTQPLLTNDQLIESLEHTNSYCLQGIQSNQRTGNDADANEMRVEELPGLESVVGVLEEVLMWPSRVSFKRNICFFQNLINH